MATSVSLDELIDALEEQSDSLLPYLNRETGEVLLISEESLELGEAEPEEIELLPDWQKEEAELAVLIETTDQYLALPDRLEVNEWNIMQEFCLEVKQDHMRAALLGAIRGAHPFRRFKEQIGNRNLWEEWNKFRRQAFGEIFARVVRGKWHKHRRPPKAIGSPLTPENSQPFSIGAPCLPRSFAIGWDQCRFIQAGRQAATISALAAAARSISIAA